jgi:hypothetical protein
MRRPGAEFSANAVVNCRFFGTRRNGPFRTLDGKAVELAHSARRTVPEKVSHLIWRLQNKLVHDTCQPAPAAAKVAVFISGPEAQPPT